MVALSSRRSQLDIPARNTPPARIFMGDVGSAFLGFTLASLAVIGGLTDARLPLAGVLVLWPFVFDTTFTLLRRLRRGENIFAAHRSHLYQRLVIAGWSHRAVTLLYLGLATLGVALAVFWILEMPGSEWLPHSRCLRPVAARASQRDVAATSTTVHPCPWPAMCGWGVAIDRLCPREV